MVILPSVLGVEGQTCKVRHEDQAMAPAADEDICVGNSAHLSKTERTSSSLQDHP